MEFNKLNDTDFPHIDNVDVYKREVTFDYSQYDNVQMVIRCLNVPWDLGEVHVGQRTVSGIGNVVKFESDTERDNWFKSKTYATTPEQAASGNFDGYAWETQYRQFHQEDEINIPLPFDMAAQFNYITIEYNPAPIDYERETGLLKWFYFSRAVESISPNKTKCIVRRDTWQTYINRIEIPYMVLERGHAPMAKTNVADYLKNPLENCKYLLNDDVNYGTLAKNAYSKAIVLNDADMYAVIASSGNPEANWGEKTSTNWTIPAGPRIQSGQPGYYLFCLPASELNSFLQTANSQIPQFISTLKAVFFISGKLVNLSTKFEFCGFTMHRLTAKNTEFDLLDLAKSQFGYKPQYADIAKLYTYPYAAIEVTDENGNSSLIKIEDTTGKLNLLAYVSIAYPYINISASVSGIGGNKRNSLTFRNVNNMAFSFDGRWYDYLYEWQIPSFAVIQSAATHNDYATHYDRQQRALEATANQTNALASNATTKSNADATADTQVANALVTTTANTAIATRSKTTITNNTTRDNEQGGWTAYISNSVTNNTTNASIDYERQSAAISAIGSAASGIMGGITSGNPVAAVGGLLNGAVSAGTTIAQTSASIHLSETRAAITVNANNQGVLETTRINRGRDDIAHATVDSNTDTNNNSITTQSANNAALAKNNATRTKNTADAIATRNYNTANSAITNSVRNARLQQPFEFGNFANGDSSTTKPQMLCANVITQNADAISKAGDYFLRYGYAHEGNWKFETFTPMPKFTFWQVSDIWVKGLDVPDLYMDEIRFFLLGGVTVWRKPEDIGNTSIYENV